MLVVSSLLGVHFAAHFFSWLLSAFPKLINNRREMSLVVGQRHNSRPRQNSSSTDQTLSSHRRATLPLAIACPYIASAQTAPIFGVKICFARNCLPISTFVCHLSARSLTCHFSRRNGQMPKRLSDENDASRSSPKDCHSRAPDKRASRLSPGPSQPRVDGNCDLRGKCKRRLGLGDLSRTRRPVHTTHEVALA